MLYFIMYKSRAALPVEVSFQNVCISMEALEGNRARSITGFLHSERESFYQYIEGPEEAVCSLFKKIRRDKRHFAVVFLARGYVDERAFPEFEMGFSTAHGRCIAEVHNDDPSHPPPETVFMFLINERDVFLEGSATLDIAATEEEPVQCGQTSCPRMPRPWC
jgi:hypothetical protein